MKKLIKSIRSQLFSIATEKKIAFQNLQIMFLLEKMVARLTKVDKLFNKIIFKGGYVGLRVFNSPRYTIDLDALVINSDIKEIKDRIVTAIESDNNDGAWFKYEKEANLLTLGEYGGSRLYFRCGIGNIPVKYHKSQSIHFDLGVGDAVVPAPVKDTIHTLVDDDLLSWMVYTIESSTAEKLHTLIIRGSDNSRSKDVFDLYHFLPQCNLTILNKALSATFSARGDKLPNSIANTISKIDRELLGKGWKSATAGLTEKVSLDEAFYQIIKFCEKL